MSTTQSRACRFHKAERAQPGAPRHVWLGGGAVSAAPGHCRWPCRVKPAFTVVGTTLMTSYTAMCTTVVYCHCRIGEALTGKGPAGRSPCCQMATCS